MIVNSLHKILFICGSMRESADGIGDYTRRLAGELIRKGHHVVVLAFNDKFVDETMSETQYDNGVAIEVLRINQHLGHHQKFKALNELVKEFQPDLVSVQYVLYAFNDKGLPFLFASDLRNVCKHTPIELMFHELWLGMEKKPVLKDRLYGIFQKYIIKKMLKQMHPKVIHTHSKAYQILLKNHNISAKFLPIISNIPVNNINYNKVSNDKVVQFLIFGYISADAPITEFISELFAWSQKNNKTLEFFFAGRNGENAKEWKTVLQSYHIKTEVLGVLDIVDLSDVMNSVDVGIATTPYLLFEKSGSVAAMLKHGLPVLNVAPSWNPEVPVNFEINEPIYEYKIGMINRFFENNFNRIPYYKNLSKVAQQFLDDFENSLNSNQS